MKINEKNDMGFVVYGLKRLKTKMSVKIVGETELLLEESSNNEEQTEESQATTPSFEIPDPAD